MKVPRISSVSLGTTLGLRGETSFDISPAP